MIPARVMLAIVFCLASHVCSIGGDDVAIMPWCPLIRQNSDQYMMNCRGRSNVFPRIISFLRTTADSLKLVGLDISHITLTNVPEMPHLAYLNHLVLAATHLHETGDLFSGDLFPRLEDLDLKYNRITTLVKGAFAGLVRLTKLNLEYNDISVIDSRAFEGLVRLKTLYLKGNTLEDLAPDTFGFTPRLQSLDLSDNWLAGVRSDWLGIPSLRILDLSDNLIVAVDSTAFVRLVGLRRLLLHSNLIENVDRSSFENMHGLADLWLSGNKLTTFDVKVFAKLSHLKQLRITSNLLRVFVTNSTDARFDFLELLDLSNNPFSSLPDDLFSRMPALSTLRLEACRELQHLPDMSGLNHLRSLDVKMTGIRQILGCDIARLPQLQFVYWQSVPVHCDCAMRWFLVWYRNRLSSWSPRRERPPVIGDPVCTSPGSVRGQKLFQLSEATLCEAQTTVTFCRSPFQVWTQPGGTVTVTTTTRDVQTPAVAVSQQPNSSKTKRVGILLFQQSSHLMSVTVTWSLTNVTLYAVFDDVSGFTVTHRKSGSSVWITEHLHSHKRFWTVHNLLAFVTYDICVSVDVRRHQAARACIQATTSTTEVMLVTFFSPVSAIFLVVAYTSWRKRKSRSGSSRPTTEDLTDALHVAVVSDGVPFPSTPTSDGYAVRPYFSESPPCFDEAIAATGLAEPADSQDLAGHCDNSEKAMDCKSANVTATVD